MKFFNQQGGASPNLSETQLGSSGNVCKCCQEFDHGASTYLPDDVECPKCGELCRCSCHRERK